MRVENFIEGSHWKLLISEIPPLHTSAALVAHLCAAAHRLGSTVLSSCLYLCGGAVYLCFLAVAIIFISVELPYLCFEWIAVASISGHYHCRLLLIRSQSVPETEANSTQTDFKRPRNAAAQTEPREYSEEERNEIGNSAELAEFIKAVAPRYLVSHLNFSSTT